MVQATAGEFLVVVEAKLVLRAHHEQTNEAWQKYVEIKYEDRLRWHPIVLSISHFAIAKGKLVCGKSTHNPLIT